MKKEKSLTRRKGEPYPLEIRLAAIGEYRLGVSRKEIAFKYSISDPTVISHWIRKFEAKRQSSVSINQLKLKKRSIKIDRKRIGSFQTDQRTGTRPQTKRVGVKG